MSLISQFDNEAHILWQERIDGRISPDEYNKAMKQLQREYVDARDNRAWEEFDRTINRE